MSAFASLFFQEPGYTGGKQLKILAQLHEISGCDFVLFQISPSTYSKYTLKIENNISGAGVASRPVFVSECAMAVFILNYYPENA